MTQPAPTTGVTLSDVRARFLEAEAELNNAAATLARLESAITQLDEARAGLRDASGEIAKLHGVYTEAAHSMRESVRVLTTGVESIRETEPAQVIQRIEQLERTLADANGSLARAIGSVSEHAERLTDGQQLLAHRLGESRDAVVNAVAQGFGSAETKQAAHVAMLQESVSTVSSALAKGISGLSSELTVARDAILKGQQEHAGELTAKLSEQGAQLKSVDQQLGASLGARMETRLLLLAVLVLGIVNLALRF